ncbi:MAG TPA: MarP family serine protease [Acidimicrobiales bacterium]|nr:MarP family serine protease [Acidimicrobiales bacterium]
MNVFDALVAVVVLGAVVGGYRVGLLARVAGWVGWILGLIAAATFSHRILDLVHSPNPQVKLLMAVGIFLLVASLGAALGEMVGFRLRSLLPVGGLRAADHAGGAVAGGFGVLVVLWLFLPALSDVPGQISYQVRNSRVARTIDSAAPRAPGPLQDLRQQVVDANFPEVFSQLRPAPSTGTPPVATALAPDLVTRVIDSTVRVSGQACGRVLTGSGFAVDAETIVTNAHVLAGVDRPSVTRPDGRRLSATVLAFDSGRDLAILDVPGLGQSPLPVGTAEVGSDGAVFGHPGGQEEVEVSPARIETAISALGRDLYGESTVRRDIYILAAQLEPGDSGGALVDTDGEVVGVAFAVAPDQPATAYALTSGELTAVLDQPRSGEVDTGPCLR